MTVRDAGGTAAGGEVLAYGASDDLLEFEGAIVEEFCDPHHPIWVELHGPGHSPVTPEGLVVVATWTDAGTWALGVAPLDEGVPMPPWPIRYAPRTADMPDYTAVLAIEVPAGTTYRGANQ